MTATKAILDAVFALVHGFKKGIGPLDVLKAVSPMLVELGMSQQILTDDAIRKIQHEVHRALRGAGLLETENLP